MSNLDNFLIPLTIEKQLENYSKKEGHTERHEILWHTWYQNKRWIRKLLQSTLFSFPTYSQHDETHAISVLSNIEMILGQRRIAELSATDCFVILHVVYIHDIGMAILEKDRKEIIQNDRFVEMLDILEAEGDEHMKRAVAVLKRTDYSAPEELNQLEQIKMLYRAKLDVFYAMLDLLSNFRRMEHGSKSAEKLKRWSLEPEELGNGFSTVGIPLRIFQSIARCAEMHTDNVFENIFHLPHKDGGYALDYFHPRFVAVLLMLGDILDMDNNRFHLFVKEFVEEFPESSVQHFNKHRSIRRLLLSPELIAIDADCEDQNALRLVRRECDMLTEILRGAGFYWMSICPEGFSGGLPALGEINLYLAGEKIPEHLVRVQFHISQKKAFSILEGSNLYEGRYIFLREFLQNAMDATRLQYWDDYCGSVFCYCEEDALSPNTMNAKLSMDRYPIEIKMQVRRKEKNGALEELSEKEWEGLESKGEYGILVSIKDCGTGIDAQRIEDISQVGNSRDRERKLIQSMPRWLRPTSEFGVGMQSAFLVTDVFRCSTLTRSGECYDITFSSGASSRYGGYINVTPARRFDKTNMTFGTCFEIFVPLDKRFSHSESICTWSGSDPFAEDYESSRGVRHAHEMISQMSLYVDQLLGETLFPVSLRVEVREPEKLMLNSRKSNSLKKLKLVKNGERLEENSKSWIFKAIFMPEEFLYGETKDVIYALEYRTAKLYVWDRKIDTFCAVSGLNIQESELGYEQEGVGSAGKKGITIYYKGIELQKRCFEEEIEIFEYIDVKMNLERSYMNLSRRDFTSRGRRYFEKEIYDELLDAVKKVLKDINERKDENGKPLLEKMTEKAVAYLDELKNARESIQMTRFVPTEYYQKLDLFVAQSLSLTLLSYLAAKDTFDELSKFGSQCGMQGENNTCQWQRMLEDISEKLWENKEKESIREDLGKRSVLFQIACYVQNSEGVYVKRLRSVDIFDIFRNDRHFGLYQRRENRYGNWIIYIVELKDEYAYFEQKMFAAPEQSKGLEDEINHYYEQLLHKFKNTDDNGDEKQQFFLKWLLRNLPTIGIFSDSTGNHRLNILSHLIYPYIYSNQNQKQLIMERIMAMADQENIQRFSTYAWQGRQYLAVKELPFSCFFVKRGYFNRAYLNKVIFPLDSYWLKKARKLIEETADEYFDNCARMAQELDIKIYMGILLEKSSKKDTSIKQYESELVERMENWGGRDSLFVRMEEFLKDISKELTKELSKDVLNLDMKAVTHFWYPNDAWERGLCQIAEAFLIRLQDKNQYKQKLEELKTDPSVDMIVRCRRFLDENLWKERVLRFNADSVKKEYRKACEVDPQLKGIRMRMLQYLEKNSYYPMKVEKWEQCFFAFEEEVFYLIVETQKKQIIEMGEQKIKSKWRE